MEQILKLLEGIKQKFTREGELMKKMILTALIITVTLSQFATAAPARAMKAREQVTAELGLAKDITGKNKLANDAQLLEAVRGMKDVEVAKLGLDKNTLLKLVKNSPESIDAVILLAQLKDSQSELKTSLELLLEGSARSMEMDAASVNNKTLGKIIELLTNSSTQSKDVIAFANKLGEEMSRSSLDVALKTASKDFAEKKNMTSEKWLEELLKCLKAKA